MNGTDGNVWNDRLRHFHLSSCVSLDKYILDKLLLNIFKVKLRGYRVSVMQRRETGGKNFLPICDDLLEMKSFSHFYTKTFNCN